MLIDFGWRGLLAHAREALRVDAGRAVVAAGDLVVRAGRRIGGTALAEREVREINRRTIEQLERAERWAARPLRRVQ